MAAVALDVMPTAAAAINVGQSRRQSVVTFALTSTPFPAKAAPVPDTLIVRRRPNIPGILIYQKAIVEDRSSIVTESDAATGSESSPTSECDTQGLCVDESPRSRTASSCSSSVSGADSTASSLRTRTTTTSSACASPCITFAPLPVIAPRKRNSNRPLGLAARSQILRERREKMEQDRFSYYDESVNSIPGGQKRGIRDDWGNSRRPEGEEGEDALVALGKALGDATKVIWRRVSSSTLRSTDSSHSASKPLPKRPNATRNFTWPGRLRTASIGSSAKALPPASALNSDEDTEDDGDGAWRRRRDEDPMTKTIVEGSDDGHGLEQFVLAYDTIPATEEEEEDHTQARMDDEIRNTVEVHLAKTSEDESEE